MNAAALSLNGHAAHRLTSPPVACHTDRCIIVMTVTKNATVLGVLNMVSALAASLRVAYVSFHHFLLDEQSGALINLYHATGGRAWEENGGWLLTTTAKQNWYGVELYSSLEGSRKYTGCGAATGTSPHDWAPGA